MQVLLAQAIQIDFGSVLAGLAGLGSGIMVYLMRDKIERIERRLDTHEARIGEAHANAVRTETRVGDHDRRIDRMERR